VRIHLLERGRVTTPRRIVVAALAVTMLAAMPPVFAGAQASKPNIVFIMGDDIGWMQPSIYHRGLMARRDGTRSSRGCIRCGRE
jgi:hypothetical protein